MHEQKDFFEYAIEKQNIVERISNYNKQHCWQYDIRLKNYEHDLSVVNLNKKDIEKIKVTDFEFLCVDAKNKSECAKIKQFIERHEWLGKMPNRPTHRFIAMYKKSIVGAIVMATPNAFSNILGKEQQNKEKLISRGACISWSPTNTASWLLMQSIKWMVNNTEYRVFTAYSDVAAKELGTIYQACNFYYLGQNFGAQNMYLDPQNKNRGWFSDREFRKQSKYRLYAAHLGIAGNEFNKYLGKWTPKWDLMPPGMKTAIKKEEQRYRQSCLVRKVKPKHKYAYIKGINKKETKQLKKLFFENNLNLDVFNYPKERGV